MKIVLLVLALLLAGCGDSADLAQVSGQPVSPNGGGPRFRLDGVWGGFFPDHQPGQGRGVEIHFPRTEREAAVLREGGPQRYEMDLTQTGNDVKIVLSSSFDPQDRSVLTGTFSDATTIKGRFVNESRGENFPIELKRHPDSDQFLNPVAPALAQQSGNVYEALSFSALASDNTLYEWTLHPGYPGGFEAKLPSGATVSGKLYMTPMNWFGEWTEFELYGDSNYQGTFWLYSDTWRSIDYTLRVVPDSGNGSFWYTDYANNKYVFLNDFEMQIVPSTKFDVSYYSAPYSPASPFVPYIDKYEKTLSVTRVVAEYLAAYSL